MRGRTRNLEKLTQNILLRQFCFLFLQEKKKKNQDQVVSISLKKLPHLKKRKNETCFTNTKKMKKKPKKNKDY
jgi:hypothetical protein